MTFGEALLNAAKDCTGELKVKMDAHIARYIRRSSLAALSAGVNIMENPILNSLGYRHDDCNMCGRSDVSCELVDSEDGLICEECNARGY